MKARWIASAEGVSTDLGGVFFLNAPIPPRRHRCRAQSRGMGVERCACGGKRYLRYYTGKPRRFGRWDAKNTRRLQELSPVN